MQGWLDWLSTLSAPWLYAAIAAAAFAENIFPPLPADTVVALGAFVAARGAGSAVGAWSATMVGNIAGAAGMFLLGRRMGMGWLTSRFPKVFPADAVAQVSQRFQSQGIAAIVLSRFIPAVRALVPPLAGALRMGVWRSLAAMTLASGAWYGLVCFVAYNAGQRADAVLVRIAAQQRLFAIVAVGVLVVIMMIIWWRRKTSRSAK